MATDHALPDLHTLHRGQRLASIWRHALRAQPLQLTGAVFGILVVAGAVLFVPGFRPPSEAVAAPSDWLDWYEKTQTLLGLATLLVAGFVWFGELREDWTEQLPRLLTFAYFHDNLPAIVCWHAYLPGESDIRALSQQLGGRQMAREEIQMRPVVEALPTELLTDGRRVYLHHRVRLELTTLPKSLAAPNSPHPRPTALVWRPRREPSPPGVSDVISATDVMTELGAELWSIPGETRRSIPDSPEVWARRKPNSGGSRPRSEASPHQ